jgi:hypothetical protein
MNAKMTVTAMLTGFPAGLIPPEPLPGETLSQLVVRNHPLEWRNCVDHVVRERGLSFDHADALRNCRFEGIQDADVWSEIERFMNRRLPSHGRTLGCLKELRDLSGELPLAMLCTYEILEVFWPRESSPDEDRGPERMAESLGATVIGRPPTATRLLNPVDYLPHINGELLWLVPGGTRIMPALAALELERVVRHFRQTPRCALYMDTAASILYRTAALRDLVDRKLPLSPDSREMARSLHLAGYTFAVDDSPDAALCEWEPEYGGPRRTLPPPASLRRPWWRRLLGG